MMGMRKTKKFPNWVVECVVRLALKCGFTAVALEKSGGKAVFGIGGNWTNASALKS
jgi:hypothetical protein